jgi:hypothetical protein
MACNMFRVGSKDAGTVGIGVADPPKFGVPGSTAAGIPGVYAPDAGAEPRDMTTLRTATAASNRVRATADHLFHISNNVRVVGS